MAKISLYTPTHNVKWLHECWDSIRSQDKSIDWEWTLIPNGSAVIPDDIASDPRVVVKRSPFSAMSVGALKGFAIQHCSGSILMEFDHDDILLPGALAWVHEVLKDGGNRFAYSACIETRPDGSDIAYSTDFGWKHSEWSDHLRKKHVYNIPFEATPRSCGEIFFAPNHLRAWTREAYESAGGYNPTMVICDDQDLLCRTYIAGAEFICHERPLYWQRMHGQNEQYKQNADIQETQARVRDRYLHQLASEWCRRENLLKIDLGGAFDCPQGFIPVDRKVIDRDLAIQCDLAKEGLPLADSSVGIVRTHDFMEHLYPDRVPFVVNEIWRVLAPGGWWDSHTPSIDGPDGLPGRGAFEDPDHKSYWSTNNHWRWTKAEKQRYNPDIIARFQTVTIKNWYPSSFHQDHRIPYVTAMLCALKGQRQPGAVGFPR